MNNRFSKLFLVGVACAALFVCSHADAATYYFDLSSKTLEGGTLALGEQAEITLRNIGTASPAALRTLLCDKEGNYLAASTNGFRAVGTSAVGDMSLATTNLAARFEGMGVLKEIPLVFAVWDTANGTLLGSSLVQVKNNPLANADGSVPMNWGGVDYGDEAIARQAYSMATNAWELAVGTSNVLFAVTHLIRDHQVVQNGYITELWGATNDLNERVMSLETGLGTAETNTANGISDLRNELLARMDAGIEPAFTNGTARGLAVTPLDHEEFLAGSLCETPGVWLTTETNQYGVTVARRLFLNALDAWLWLGPGGLEAAGDISATGYTLGSTTVRDWGLFATAGALGAASNYFRGLIVTNQNSLQNRINSLDNAINKGNDCITNRLRRLENGTGALEGRIEEAEDEIRGLNQSATWAYNRCVEASNSIASLNTATSELNTIARTNQAAISNLWNAIAPLSGMTTAAFTNGTARGLAVTPIDHADFLSSFRRTPGLWATTEYDYRGDPIGQYLFLNGWYSSLALTPTGIVADATIHAPGYTLGTNTVTDWRMFATAEELAEMENRVNGQFNDISDAFAEDFATYTYVDTKIAGISNMMGGITVSNGEVSVDLVGLTDAISDLQIATNHIADNYVKKSGDTMADWLIVRRLIVAKESQNGYSVAGAGAFAQGTAPWILGENGFAAGNHAKVTNGTAFVWSGASGTNYYGSHGDGSFSINPVGGLDGIWIGDRNLRQHFYNETVTALSGMHGGVELLPGANITITTNPVDGTLTIASTASGGGGGTVTNTVTLGTLTAGNGYIQVEPQGTEGWSISSDPGVASLNGATGALRLLRCDGNQLGVTDGAIRLPAPDRSAIETLGEEVFKAQVVVTTNSPAITGFEVDADNDEATITFYASVETNRLEWYDPAEEEPEWTAWDNCSWSYTGTQGTCTLVGPQEGAFYRILVPEGYTTPDRTNVYLVASVPIYFGEAGVEENRFATMADVAAAVARGSGTTRIAAVTRRGYSDPMNVSPTNVAWNFSGDGVYFQDLSVGGWTNEISTVTTNGGTVTTNTTTVTDTGSITLNGQRIHSWGELAIYADGAEITVETGVSGVNGIEGAVTLEAGDNVTLSKNAATGTITISATGGGGGGGGGGGSGPWNPNTRVISATNATVLASDYLIWMDSEAAEDEQTIFLPDMATDSQSIVIRHLGSDHPTTIVRATATATNTYQLTGDGASIAVDWLGAKNIWYWRQAY